MKMQSFPKTEAEVNAVLPATVKVINKVKGIRLNSGASSSGSVSKKMPIMPVEIPVGTVLKIKLDEKNDSRIETDYKVNGNVVYTTPKQLIGNVEFEAKETEPTEANETNDTGIIVAEKEGKNIFTPKNILIGVGILVAGYLAYKYFIKK